MSDNLNSRPGNNLAVIGSGPTGLYFLWHLLQDADRVRPLFNGVTVFEKQTEAGFGMPYSPATTDAFNMCNISSAELPLLAETFVDWMRGQPPATLRPLGVDPQDVHEDGIYPRLALGSYFRAQFEETCRQLDAAGLPVTVRAGEEVKDIREEPDAAVLTTSSGAHRFAHVVIATGHSWTGQDDPDNGYYVSPWPIAKLLPRDGELYDFPIGLLGASLSAYDVANSLARRHGQFARECGQLVFHPRDDAPNFRLRMHSAEGWLPHLQYAQEEPFRRIYRHVSEDALLALRDEDGLLRLDRFFDEVCRGPLAEAFAKEGRVAMAEALSDGSMSLENFVETLSAEHSYSDAFEGMRTELEEARRLLEMDRPVFWMEILDDLMYTLNFHTDLLPAEDHLRLTATVMPFLMNVVAAMPVPSAEVLLALHDAGRLELITGRVTSHTGDGGMTRVTVDTDCGTNGDRKPGGAENNGRTTTDYRLFLDCGGQSPVNVDELPYPSLRRQGRVRAARLRFADARAASGEDLIETNRGPALSVGGLDIDGLYRLIGEDGKPSRRVTDIAFPQLTGLRPYSYGLQACSDTAAIVVRGWTSKAADRRAPAKPEDVAETQSAI